MFETILTYYLLLMGLAFIGITIASEYKRGINIQMLFGLWVGISILLPAIYLLTI